MGKYLRVTKRTKMSSARTTLALRSDNIRWTIVVYQLHPDNIINSTHKYNLKYSTANIVPFLHHAGAHPRPKKTNLPTTFRSAPRSRTFPRSRRPASGPSGRVRLGSAARSRDREPLLYHINMKIESFLDRFEDIVRSRKCLYYLMVFHCIILVPHFGFREYASAL